MRHLVLAAAPLTVLDGPCGTGRLFPAYRESTVQEIVGIDVSMDMLRIATQRVRELGLTGRFLQASLLEPDSLPELTPVDLVVCVRFLNWISWKEAERVVALLRPLASQHMILGITVQEARKPLLRTMKRHLVRVAHAARGNREVPIYVHQPERITELFARLGLMERSCEPTFSSEGRTNYLYLLQAQ
jgi:SAM-dependent methyltransferase